METLLYILIIMQYVVDKKASIDLMPSRHINNSRHNYVFIIINNE